MTVQTIITALSRHAGITAPASATSSTEDEVVRLVQFSEEAADEIARRVDWGQLRATTTLTGTGSNDDFVLPAAFSRLTQGNAVTVAGTAVRGGLSADEWHSLTAAEGTPRFFRLIGTEMSFFPYPANGTDVSVSYQSKYWCDNGTAQWAADGDAALFPEDLIVKGALWRWKRYTGENYDDYLAEFEAALADYAGFDGRGRV